RACALERQVSVVVETQLEHAVVVDPGTAGDRLHRGKTVAEPDVAARIPRVLAGKQRRVLAQAVADKGERAADGAVWPDDARDGHRHRLQPAEVLPWVIEVEHRFRDVNETLAVALELEQRDRIQLGQRYVLGQLVIAPAQI